LACNYRPKVLAESYDMREQLIREDVVRMFLPIGT
jgi:hypothetical protein